MRRCSIILLLAAVLVWTGSCSDNQRLDKTLILISLDGFRDDFLRKAPTPTLDRIAASGVRAEWLIPVFPSKTFPNHYSIVTGLYPEHHGIVSNNIYDPVFDARFRLADREAVGDGRWWGGKPIWVSVSEQGQKSATLFWPGSEAEVAGRRPDYWKPYDGDLSHENRNQQVCDWLNLPAGERPVFISLYFSLVDDAGHRYGPDSNELVQAVEESDQVLAQLLSRLEEMKVLDQVNILIVSDHGMAATSPERVIILDDYVDLRRVKLVDTTPVAALIPNEDYFEEAYNNLQNAHPNLSVYRKEEVPERFRYRSHRRIAPLIGIADAGWTIMTRKRYLTGIDRMPRGDHGYDHESVEMRGIFLAQGPAFKQGFVAPPLRNVHLYPLMAEILGVEVTGSDGDLDQVRQMLNSAPD